jgi:hypothetical protein
MIGKLKDLMKTRDGDWLVSFTTRVDPRPLFDEFTGKDVNVEIKKASKHRSKTANDFCWALCTDIGNAIRPPIPKEEVYRKAIKDVGKFENLCVRSDAVDFFRKTWEQRGAGWITEVIDYCQAPGYKTVFAYYGSSTYDTVEMSILIDYLKQDAVNMGLTIPISKEEEERLLAQWGKALSKKTSNATYAEK